MVTKVPTLDQLEKDGNIIISDIEDAKTKPGYLQDRVGWLSNINRKIALTRGEIQKIINSCEGSVSKLAYVSWSRFTFKFGYGVYGSQHTRAQKIVNVLDQRVQELYERWLGIVQSSVGEESSTILAACDELLKLRPDNVPVLRVQAKILMKERACAAAADVLSSLHKRFPDNREIHQELIQALIGAEKYENALNEILSNDRPEWVAFKAECYAGCHQYQEALSIVFDIIRNNPSVEAYKEQAILYMMRQELHGMKDPLTELQKSTCMAQVKARFSDLGRHQHAKWSRDSLSSDLDLWFQLLSTQQVVYDRKELRTLIVSKIQELVNAHLVPLATMMTQIEQFFTGMIRAHDSFAINFRKFMMQTTISPADGKAGAVFEAKRHEILKTLNGSDGLRGCCGLEVQFEVALELIEFFKRHTRFSDVDTQVKLILRGDELKALPDKMKSHKTTFTNSQTSAGGKIKEAGKEKPKDKDKQMGEQ